MKNYLRTIKENHPEILVKKYELNTEGQNNDILIINDNLIFKFPKYDQGIEKLKRETSILGILTPYISMNIPHYKYINCSSHRVGQVYAGYNMLQGIPLRRNVFLDIVNKEIASGQLATFLKELHSISPEVIDNEAVTVSKDHSLWERLYEKIEKKLFSYMKIDSREAITESFSSFFKDSPSFTPAIIHGDFGPSNILYDQGNEIISGIIDFNDVSIGDPAVDFASLIGPFGYGVEFVKGFEDIYPGTEELLKRAKFYASTFALQEALFGLEMGDKEAFNAGMRAYM